MEPDSITVVVVLLVVAAATLTGVIRFHRLPAKIACGALTMVLSVLGGVAVVNDYYGYYQSWSELGADLTGSYAGFTTVHSPARGPAHLRAGELRAVTLAGPRSGIDRRGLVYLPPQYFQPAYRNTRFPVVELVHGTPGHASDWVVHLRVVQVLERLLADHRIGPMILVMPTMSVGTHYEECVDAPGALDDTYMSADVRADVNGGFRASTDAAQWGIAGYSSGGYCAANLALRHRADFGAAAMMDGYFQPTAGPAAAALQNDPAAEDANNPLLTASRLAAGAHPLPGFWLAAGTGDSADQRAARDFVHALHGVEQATLYREPGAGHNFYAWRPALAPMLVWMWSRLASPDLRVQFPIAGGVHHALITPGRPGPTPSRSGQASVAASATASMPASFRCSGVMGAGAPVSGSYPPPVFGKAITSRMESLPDRSAAIRSQPKAIPPCGGAP
jgi:enterochelin esterase-like enzyme